MATTLLPCKIPATVIVQAERESRLNGILTEINEHRGSILLANVCDVTDLATDGVIIFGAPELSVPARLSVRYTDSKTVLDFELLVDVLSIPERAIPFVRTTIGENGMWQH